MDEDWDYTIITSVSDGSWLDASFISVGREEVAVLYIGFSSSIG